MERTAMIKERMAAATNWRHSYSCASSTKDCTAERQCKQCVELGEVLKLETARSICLEDEDACHDPAWQEIADAAK